MEAVEEGGGGGLSRSVMPAKVVAFSRENNNVGTGHVAFNVYYTSQRRPILSS